MIMHVYWISGSGWSDPIIVASANVLPNTSIAAISRKSNTIEVFWVGNDYSIQHAYWYDTIGWAGPFALTNPNTVDGWSAQPDLAVVSRNPYDKLEVFFRGREMYQKLHHVYWSEGVPENGFWSGKTQIPGSIYAASGKLAAISRASDAIEVFFHGTDYEVHHTYWDGSNWNNGGIVNASESRGDALGGIAAVTRASSSTQMEAWYNDYSHFFLQDLTYAPATNWQTKALPRWLPLTLHPQEQSLWCWAATEQMVLEFFGVARSQATLAYDLSYLNCWSYPDSCNFGSCFDLTRYGFSYRTKNVLECGNLTPMGDSPLTFGELQSQFKGNQPVAFAWSWTAGGGHEMVATDAFTHIDGTQWVTVFNPGPVNQGEISDMAYSWWQSGPDHQHQKDFYSFSHN